MMKKIFVAAMLIVVIAIMVSIAIGQPVPVSVLRFLRLVDTPNSYSGQDGKFVKVDETNSKLVFDNALNTFIGMSDTPSSFTGEGSKLVRVNSGETALEFVATSSTGDMTKAVYDTGDDGYVDGNDTPYGTVWDGDVNAPSMNAVYDKIESLSGGGGGDGNVGWVHDGSLMFDGLTVTTWTDLDLSSKVGANTTMVMLKIYNDDPTSNYKFYLRTNGETLNTMGDGASGIYDITDGEMEVVVGETDSSGIVEWKTNDLNENIQIYLLGYISESSGVDEIYGVGWDNDTDPPEKDDIYDYLHNFDIDDDGSFTDETWYTNLLNGTTAFTDLNGQIIDSDNYVVDSIDETHINWGSAAGQIDYSDITTGNISTSGTIEGATITESGNDVYNSADIPGGELGGTWAAPTIDDSLSVSGWTLTSSTLTSPSITSPTITTSLTATDLITNSHFTHSSDWGDISTDGTGNVVYDADSIDDTHINWGTAPGQVSTDDIDEGSNNLYMTEERVEDHAGGMLGGTETHISVTYQDTTNDIDFIVDPDSVAGAISEGSYANDSIVEADLKATNAPVDNYILSYDAGGGFTWVQDQASAGGGDPVLVNATDITDPSGVDLTNGTGITITLNTVPSPDTATIAATLGTAIDTSEITDGTILEADLNATNTPIDNYILSYNATGSNFEWVQDQTGGAGGNSIYIEEGDVARVDSSAADVYLDFDGTNFDVGVVGNEGNVTLANDGIDSQHYIADSIDNEHINWTNITNLGEAGTITVADTADTTAFVALWESATGDLTAKSDAGLTYNAATGTLDSTAITEGGIAVLNNDDIDSSSELAAIIDDETGSGTGSLIVFNQAPIFDRSLQIERYHDAFTGNPILYFFRSRDGVPTYDVSIGDKLGEIIFQGNKSGAAPAAVIEARVDNTPGIMDMPGNLKFSTTPDGSYTPTLRMTIDSEGDIELGADDNTANLVVHSGGTLTMYDDSDDTSVSATVTDGTTTLAVTGTINATALQEGGNDVYNSADTPGGELSGTWASPTINDGLAVSNWNLTTPTITTQLTMTAQTDPVTDADGEIALDTDGWGTGYDAYEVFNGTASAYLVATTASDTPTNGQVPKWNSTGEITWEDDNTGGAGGNSIYIEEGDVARVDSSAADVYLDFDGTNFDVGVVGNEGNVTIANNGITLATHTTGNYVATVVDAGSSTVTVTGSGTENAAVNLDVADDGLTNAHFTHSTDWGDISTDASGNVTYDVDSVDDTHINWGSGAAQVDLADVPGGTAGAYTFDFGGANIEIENGTDPDLTTTGEISLDTNAASEVSDASIRASDGTNQWLVARKLKTIQATIIKPNDLADTTRDKCPIWSNESGMVFNITKIEAWSDTDDTAFMIEEYAADGATGQSNVDSVNCTNGTGPYTATETSITDSSIAANALLVIDFDDTDDPGWVKVTICGWFNADIN